MSIVNKSNAIDDILSLENIVRDAYDFCTYNRAPRSTDEIVEEVTNLVWQK